MKGYDSNLGIKFWYAKLNQVLQSGTQVSLFPSSSFFFGLNKMVIH